jgi:hypothetical protein
MRICPECGTRSALSFAILPRETTVVCEACFVKGTGHYPLPAGDGLSMLGFHLGQRVNDPLGGPSPQAGMPAPPRVTINGVTIRGVTIRGVTIRGVTIREQMIGGVTIGRVPAAGGGFLG